MTLLPAWAAAIDTAELRLLRSKRNVRQSVDRTRSALHAVIARPSTWIVVAITSGISVFLVSRLRRTSVESSQVCADPGSKAPGRGLVRTFISLYGAQVIAFALHHGAAAYKQGKPCANSDMPVTSIPGDTATPEQDSAGSDKRPVDRTAKVHQRPSAQCFPCP